MRRRKRRILTKSLAALLAFLLYASPVIPAAAQDFADEPAPDPASDGDLGELAREEPLSEELVDYADEPVVDADEVAPALDEAAQAALDDVPPDTSDATPLSLPSGDAKSAVTPQTISLPDAEGSIEGMGESFSPVLSSGTGTFSVPIALPGGRAGVQPSLSLAYSTSGGNGPVGFGWSLGVPFISRQSDRGLPRYVDETVWHAEEDRFLYNGGQELVPVDSAAMETVDGYGASTPAEFTDWQQYRARVEGGFMRFFRSPDSTRWVVQSKDGTRFDFGVLPAGDGPPEMGTASWLALQSELGAGEGRIYRWQLTRMSDAHGSTVYYRYFEDEGQVYLDDIHYVSPASGCAASSPATQRSCAQPLSDYGVRVALDYEARPDVLTSYVSGWRVATAKRLARVTVTAAGSTAGSRFLVRRYHLSYEPSANSWHSLLSSIQVEGRPENDATTTSEEVDLGIATFAESALGDAVVGRLLPPMQFYYTQPTPTGASIEGFGGVVGTVFDVGASPPHSVDEGRSDLFDVNSDGLPDLIVTDPARYRTADGDPAVGVFFNGFAGADASPASGGTFSDAVPMPMSPGLSGTLSLSNLNVRPMDIDGEGRSDLLHMPRRTTYGWFAPTRGPAAELSPASQGWRWTYAQIDISADSTDPRIDLTRDSPRIKTLDVNNDHLIDIVRTTGTVTQTWLNLGWLPGGEGRFGTATYTGSTWALSTDPLESCLLQDGLPVDFADPEVQLADMNGDGLQDIVKIRRGRVVWWPGRGPGLWGDGPSSCARGEGAGRGVVMATPPAELNPETSGVYLQDVNADGAADVVQVRYDAVDVWFNRGGASFTERLITRGTPYAPDYATRIRFADIDGSGTADIVWGNAGRWKYVDPMGGVQPRLLEAVDNGLGAWTNLEYASSVEDYLRDLADADACASSGCESFDWQFLSGGCDQRLLDLSGECVYRSGNSPVVSTVVRAVETSDRFAEVGREENVMRTEYAYHDGYYEGIEQEFRGFGAADAVSIGDPTTHPTGVTRTWFYQGRRPNDIAGDRLADNRYESLKGRAFFTEASDLSGVYLSSTHSSYAVRELATGLDGRGVWYAFVHQTDDLRYDTADFAAGADTVDLTAALRFESVDGSGAVVVDESIPTTLYSRASNWAHLRTTTDSVDNVGNVLQQTAHGRLRGEDGEVSTLPDETIVTHTTPELCDGDAWIWRTSRSYVTGHGDATPLGDTANTFGTVACDLTKSVQQADVPAAFEFNGDSEGAETFTQGDQDLIASTKHDTWGNALESCAGADVNVDSSGCYRHTILIYDTAYEQLPESEAVANSGSSGSGFTYLSTTATWDRGLGVILTTTDPNLETTEVGYDGLGRLTFVRPPKVEGCLSKDTPTHRFDYELAVGGRPVSVIHAWEERGCNYPGQQPITTRSYVDGLGRARASVVQKEGTDKWVQADVVTFTPRGSVHSTYQAETLSTADPTIEAALAIPTTPRVQSLWDAFSRESQSIAEDSATTSTYYGALSTEVWDPLDLEMGNTQFESTPTITRTDGHGRVIDQILINRQLGSSTDEYYRLWSTYRADGAVTALTRAETTDLTYRASASIVGGHTTSRAFTYDTAGRRIASTDPDTDSTDPTKGATNETWRYLFNKVGDLAAVRDPRGCGQNFYYDRAGRLVAEDYVRCDEAQASGDSPDDTVPAGSVALVEVGTGQGADVVNYFDGVDPGWPGFTRPTLCGTTSCDAGRLTATTDRAQRIMLAYDRRGNVSWQGRQMALLPDKATNVPTTLTDPPGVFTGEDIVPQTRVFDESHTYEQSFIFEHSGRTKWAYYPTDPDYAGTAPVMKARQVYNRRGLPTRNWVDMIVGTETVRHDIVWSTSYNASGLVKILYLDDDQNGGRTRTRQWFNYDSRLRLTRTYAIRTATPGAMLPDLAAVTRVLDQWYTWDSANNLTEVLDGRLKNEWDDGSRPQQADIQHDALYRVAAVDYTYKNASGTWVTSDAFSDWRAERTRTNGDGATHEQVDPMRERPAALLPAAPAERPVSLVYAYDWLANMTEWTDDAAAFYERSIGANIANGFDEGLRPSALYLSSDLPTSAPTPDVGVDRGGWLELDYGESGNVEAMTVHAQCHDADAMTACWDDVSQPVSTRRSSLRSDCVCAAEQHYQYRWDELNRLAEARRYERAGTGDWEIRVRQRYRYDGANQRMIKETITDDPGEASPPPDRTNLYIYPGDFERSGVERNPIATTYDASATLNTETQYLIGGARIVWRSNPDLPSTWPDTVDRDLRMTYALTDLLQSSSAVVDLYSGDLLEVSTWLPNGGRESHRTQTDVSVQPEPLGFTGKEADDEVGVVYFGERYLIPRIGRWASPDPLHVHAAGGGEALNSYHYVGGNLLEARDPKGMDYTLRVEEAADGGQERVIHVGVLVVAGNRQSVNAPQREVTRQDLEQAASEIKEAMENSYQSFEEDGVRYRFEIDVQVSDSEPPVENQRSTSLQRAGPDTRTATSALDEAADRGLENIAVINPTLAGEDAATTRADGSVPEPAERGLLSHPGDTMLLERGAAPRTYAHEGAHLLGLGHVAPTGNVTDSEPQRLRADRAAGLDAPVASRHAQPLSAQDRVRIHEAAQNALDSESVQLGPTEIPAESPADQ